MQRSPTRLSFGVPICLLPICLLLICLLLTGQLLRAQVSFNLPSNPAPVNISGVEYFFDTDPGAGLATALTLTPGNPVTISNASIPISSLSNGIHHFFVRTRDANGHWSLTNNQTLFIVTPVTIPSNSALPDVSKAEYFFDTDPGPGQATAIPLTAGLNVTISNYAINISSLTAGIHHLFIRTADANGHWSLTNNQALFVVNAVTLPSNPALVNVTSAEYFFDTDPGIGKGAALSVTAGLTTNITGAIPLTGLATGIHRLYLRTADADGRWSLTNESNLAILNTSLIIPSNPAPGNITLLEYFFDTDPGFGNGTEVAITGTTNLVNYTFTVDVSSLAQGDHNFYVRAFDGWSQTTVVPMHFGVPLPVTLLSFTASLESNHTVDLNWTTSNEVNNQYYAIQRSGNAVDFDSIGSVPGAGTTGVQQSYAYIDDSPLPGMNYYRLKQVDHDGHATWSPIVSVRDQGSLQVSLFPNPAHDLLTVSLGTAAAGKGVFRIVDMRGRTVQSANATADDVQQLNIAALEPGTYILQYLTTTNSTTIPFIKF
jgi:hypothetical protein